MSMSQVMTNEEYKNINEVIQIIRSRIFEKNDRFYPDGTYPDKADRCGGFWTSANAAPDWYIPNGSNYSEAVIFVSSIIQ